MRLSKSCASSQLHPSRDSHGAVPWSDSRNTPEPAILLRAPTPVDQYVGSGDESRFFRAQKDGEMADLFRLTPPAERNLRKKLSVQLRVLDQGRIHLGGERTGTDAVHRDPFRRELECERMRQPEQSGFARRIGPARRDRDMRH